ncbi:hypothetical protein [Actinoplanes sp. NPDC049681]|uniref:hypothetical protein n=1 Tax=Actinoplanes sp. NPDC049681 TaxID=3363905 RepID=UPI00378D21BA
MSLTGIPLIVLTGGLAVAALAVTVRTWSRGRVLTRTLVLICAELLVVATAGLIENRDQTFYPTWHDLVGGGTETETVAAAPSAPPPLDTRPPGDGIIVPAGYADRPGTAYPVIVVLCGRADVDAARAAARTIPDVITVALVPRTAADVTRMIDRLPHLARVTGQGRALVADRPHRALARRLQGADPGFAAVVTAAGGWDAALAKAADRLPAPLAAPLRP